MNPIPPWSKSANFSVSRHQQLVDHANGQGLISGAGAISILNTPSGFTVADESVPLICDIGFGTITDTGPSGEGNFGTSAGNIYWTKKEKVIAGSTPTTRTTLDDELSPNGEMVVLADGELPKAEKIVCATDILVDDVSTRRLTNGANVLLIGIVGQLSGNDQSRAKRYLAIPSPTSSASTGSGLTLVKVTGTHSAGLYLGVTHLPYTNTVTIGSGLAATISPAPGTATTVFIGNLNEYTGGTMDALKINAYYHASYFAPTNDTNRASLYLTIGEDASDCDEA